MNMTLRFYILMLWMLRLLRLVYPEDGGNGILWNIDTNIQNYTVLFFYSEDEEMATPETLVFVYQLQDATSTCRYTACFICLHFFTCFCFHSGNPRFIGQ